MNQIDIPSSWPLRTEKTFKKHHKSTTQVLSYRFGVTNTYGCIVTKEFRFTSGATMMRLTEHALSVNELICLTVYLWQHCARFIPVKCLSGRYISPRCPVLWFFPFAIVRSLRDATQPSYLYTRYRRIPISTDGTGLFNSKTLWVVEII